MTATDKARALIAEGREHESVFADACDSGSIEVVGETKDDHIRIRASVEWMHDNLTSIIHHLAAALDENERLRAGLAELRVSVNNSYDYQIRRSWVRDEIDALLATPTIPTDAGEPGEIG